MHNRLPLLTATITACIISHAATAQTTTNQQWPVLQPTGQAQRQDMQQKHMQQQVQKNMMQQQRATMPQAGTAAPQNAIQRYAPAPAQPHMQHHANQPMHQKQMPQQFMHPTLDPRHPSHGIRSQGGGAIPALPLHIMVSPANVYFVNGGIGDEEMQQLAMVENEFNLHIQLSDGEGAYISDITLRLLNEKGGELLNVTDAGPYVYAKLPAGNYILESYDAAHKIVKKKAFKVREKGITKQYVMHKSANGTY